MISPKVTAAVAKMQQPLIDMTKDMTHKEKYQFCVVTIAFLGNLQLVMEEEGEDEHAANEDPATFARRFAHTILNWCPSYPEDPITHDKIEHATGRVNEILDEMGLKIVPKGD